MTTADDVVERAIVLANSGVNQEEGVNALLDCCAGRRVSVVLARRALQEREGGTDDPSTQRALELIEGTLVQLPE